MLRLSLKIADHLMTLQKPRLSWIISLSYYLQLLTYIKWKRLLQNKENNLLESVFSSDRTSIFLSKISIKSWKWFAIDFGPIV